MNTKKRGTNRVCFLFVKRKTLVTVVAPQQPFFALGNGRFWKCSKNRTSTTKRIAAPKTSWEALRQEKSVGSLTQRRCGPALCIHTVHHVVYLQTHTLRLNLEKTSSKTTGEFASEIIGVAQGSPHLFSGISRGHHYGDRCESCIETGSELQGRKHRALQQQLKNLRGFDLNHRLNIMRFV